MTSDKKTTPDPTQAIYQEVVLEEISFSRATGYDKELTAVVPLAELARREENRLRQSGRGEPAAEGLPQEGAQPECTQDGNRRIPMGEIIDVLRAARSVEEVAGVLVEIVANLIPRVLLLWERKQVLYGFASRGMGLSEVKLLTIELPRLLTTEMTGVDSQLESYLGPPRLVGQVPRLFEILGAVPPEILLVPVCVTPQDSWVLYADNRLDPLPKVELRLIEIIVSRAGAKADLLLDREMW